ncbi:septicolysin [Hesseltinella vesiculosa]|uniref:Septicolysin n=1 Tax=Hesseltinella vesiculosa TaxID=101127 RepID=A0A1X2GNZ1_9FUNG|nr:septicolysin [Hesseltinella vesiculosa]
MKLAEALVYRSDLDTAINQLKERLVQNSIIQDGTNPAEAPEALFEELDSKMKIYEDLVVRINSSNLTVKTESGLTLTHAIAKRDSLQRLHGILNAVCNNANNLTDRYSRSEILKVSTVDIPSLRKKIDGIAKERRGIECEIQAANWTNELV